MKILGLESGFNENLNISCKWKATVIVTKLHFQSIQMLYQTNTN